MSNLKDSLVWKEHIIKVIREGKVNVPTFNVDKYKVTKGGQLVMKGKKNELEELKQEAEEYFKNLDECKTKEIIRDFLSVAIDYIDKEDKNYSFILEAEQFLNSEVEK